MPITSFNNVAIYFFGSASLDSSFPQSNMYGTVIVMPADKTGNSALALMVCSYPDKAYLGKYIVYTPGSSSSWIWTALN